MLKSEGFIIRSGLVDGAVYLVSDGSTRGAGYGCYEALQQMGFAFLHPLQPVIPSAVSCAGCSNATEQPYWPVRGWHIHTEHPLELTDFLQGFDVAVNGSVVEPWESMMDDWLKFLDWSVANKINQVCEMCPHSVHHLLTTPKWSSHGLDAFSGRVCASEWQRLA